MNADGFLKVIIDLDGEIPSCHVIESEASDLIQEVVVVMKAGTVQDIRESAHIHPRPPRSRPVSVRRTVFVAPTVAVALIARVTTGRVAPDSHRFEVTTATDIELRPVKRHLDYRPLIS